jgi:Ca2+-binding EF-hand superfamily protein
MANEVHETADQLFTRFDRNKDGLLDESELVSFMR